MSTQVAITADPFPRSTAPNACRSILDIKRLNESIGMLAGVVRRIQPSVISLSTEYQEVGSRGWDEVVMARFVKGLGGIESHPASCVLRNSPSKPNTFGGIQDE